MFIRNDFAFFKIFCFSYALDHYNGKIFDHISLINKYILWKKGTRWATHIINTNFASQY